MHGCSKSIMYQIFHSKDSLPNYKINVRFTQYQNVFVCVLLFNMSNLSAGEHKLGNCSLTFSIFKTMSFVPSDTVNKLDY